MNKILLSFLSLIVCHSSHAQSMGGSPIPPVLIQINNSGESEIAPTLGGVQGMILSAKVILSGPYDPIANLMSDQLRVAGVIPLQEPYTDAPYFKPVIGGLSGETVTQDLLDIVGDDAIVDWIYIELRSASNMNVVIATKRALLQRDGDIVSSNDGVSSLVFEGLTAGNYYVSVKHRNHLGVMTFNTVSFNSGTVSFVDFTSDPVWIRAGENNAPRNLIGTVWALWAGDANQSKSVKYNGLMNDKQEILNAIGSSTPNNTLSSVYRAEDLNMDAEIKYNNSNNDRNVISNTVGSTTLNNIVNQQTPN